MTVKANVHGVLSGKFIIPQNIPAGTKEIRAVGKGGSYGAALFSGQGTLVRNTMQEQTTVTETRWQSPPPPPPPPPPAPPPPVIYNPSLYVGPLPTTPSVPSADFVGPIRPIQQFGPGISDSSAPIYSVAPQTWGTTAGNAVNFTVNAAGVPDGTVLSLASYTAGSLFQSSVPWSVAIDNSTALTAVVNNGSAVVPISTSLSTNSVMLAVTGDSLGNPGTDFVGVGFSLCYVDPLAQTFTLAESKQIVGVDLWFSQVGNTPIDVHIRKCSGGFPTLEVLARTRVLPSQITTVEGSTRVTFDTPVLLDSGTQYAIVVICNDPDSACRVAEIGKWDSNSQHWITTQPYTVGNLLSSSDAVSWTVHQEKDLTFRLLVAEYSQASLSVDLGLCPVKDATDLMLMAYHDRPSNDCSVSYTFTLPDGSVVSTADGKPVRLKNAVTGDVSVKATITSQSASLSPILHPGIQLMSGVVANTADYVTRAVPAGANSKIILVFDMYCPAGASVVPTFSGIDVVDTWQSFPVSSSKNIDDGFVEMTYTATGISEAAVRAKLVLNGTTDARPRVRNLRLMVV